MSRRPKRPAEVPLLVWAARQAARKSRPRPWRWIAPIGVGIGLVGLGIMVPTPPRLIWNASASAPVGLYWIEPGAEVKVGDLVAAWPPIAARQLADARGYLPFHAPLVKAVGAIAGDDVCAFGQEILINGRQAGERRLTDLRGRALPSWAGCVRLRGRALFLFNPARPDSFDGRYFGVSRGDRIIGKAHLLWAR